MSREWDLFIFLFGDSVVLKNSDNIKIHYLKVKHDESDLVKYRRNGANSNLCEFELEYMILWSLKFVRNEKITNDLENTSYVFLKFVWYNLWKCYYNFLAWLSDVLDKEFMIE